MRRRKWRFFSPAAIAGAAPSRANHAGQDAMRILEFNAAFANLFGRNAPRTGDAPPSLEGMRLDNEISSQELAQKVVSEALLNDNAEAKDDITCGVIYYRNPRRLLVVTGPPFAKERDGELAELVSNFPGRKIICGGTTASIVSRLLNRPVKMSLSKLDPVSRRHRKWRGFSSFK